MLRILPLVAAWIGLGALSPAAWSYSLDPIVTVIELPSGSSGETIVVRNPRDFPLAVTFEIVERTVHDDGTETQAPADDMFLIFPPQAIVPAGRTQALRVQWVGPRVSASRSFTLYGVEAPVNLAGEDGSGIRTILKIGASVHVTQTGLRSKPVLSSSQKVDNGVEVQIANEGNRFIYVDDLALTFEDKTVAGQELANFAVRTLIPPGATRTFVVPDVDGVPALKRVR
ncbi:MAG: fimbria/pilus periplasmic chaperone [Hyphomonas sp.]|nr:fimbria/pilus periplasmic chaperone [Hyphomonas sp.]